MGWDPDSLAASVPLPAAPSTTGGGSISWNPDAHIDAAVSANSKYDGMSFWDKVKGDLGFAGPETVRGAGLVARGAAEGVAATPNMAADLGIGAVNLAKRGAKAVGLDDNPQYMPSQSSSFTSALDAAGLPKPQNAGDQVLTAAAGLATGVRMPQPMAEQAPGQLLAPNTRVPLANQTAGQVTGSVPLQEVESTIGRMPGGGAIRSSITQQKQNLAGGVQQTIDSLAGSQGTTPYSVGSKLDPAIAQGAKDLKDAGGRVFDAVDAKIPASLTTPLTNSRSLLAGFTKIDPNAPATSGLFKDPAFLKIQQAVDSDMTVPGTAAKPSSILGPDGAPAFTTPGTSATAKAGLPYQTVKGLVSDLSQTIDWSPLNGDAVNGAKKALYLSMRKDLNEAASGVSPELGAQVQKANANWGDTKDRLDALNNAVGGNGGVEQIFNRLVTGAKVGPSGLSNVMDVLSDSNQRLLAASMLQKMGTPNAEKGAFDADTFFKNWGAMDTDAKDRLFGSLPQEYRKNMDTLVSNAKALKAYANVMPNGSNTAKAGAWVGTIGFALAELLNGNVKTAAVAGLGVPAATYSMSKVLTNPKVVAYLARKSSPAQVLGLVPGAKAAVSASAPQQ